MNEYSLAKVQYHYKLTNLKYQSVNVNSAKENCGNPQKSFLL